MQLSQDRRCGACGGQLEANRCASCGVRTVLDGELRESPRREVPCIFCGERVLYDLDLSANLNGVTGCTAHPSGLHVGDPGAA
jgi:hypothetical protein